MEAKIIQQTSVEDAYRKFEEMGLKQIESLRKLTKDVQESRKQNKDEIVKKSLVDYDENLEQ